MPDAIEAFLEVARSWSAAKSQIVVSLLVFEGDEDFLTGEVKGRVFFKRDDPYAIVIAIDEGQSFDIDLRGFEIAYIGRMEEEGVVINETFRLRRGNVALHLYVDSPVGRA